MFILDTDTLSEYFKLRPSIVLRFNGALHESTIVITTVTYFEILKGRYAALLKAANAKEMIVASERLERDRFQLQRFEILSANPSSAEHFENLLRIAKFRSIGRPDLIIASLALAQSGTVVTRNVRDFARVPGLKIENWFS